MTDLAGPIQRVSAVLPAGAQFTPPQANGTTTNVKVQVTLGGGTGVWAGILQVNF